MAACAKCTLAVPAKWVSDEDGGEVSLMLGSVVAVIVAGVAVVVLAVKAGLGADFDVEEGL